MNDADHAGYDPEDVDFGKPDGRPDARIDTLKRLMQSEIAAHLSEPVMVEKPLPAEPIALDEQVHGAGATEAILNAQLLECVGMVRDAGFLYRNSKIPPDDRGYFINHTGRLMEISAKLAEAINRLRGAPEPVKTTRHVTVVEHVVGGGGTPNPENE
jgi:hypothetical protein